MQHRVLLIDDAPDVHFVVAQILARQPIELVNAFTGARGLQKANEAIPDLILLDVDMPGADGFEICRQLKANVDTSTVPVVFLTGATSTEAKIQGLGLGAVDYITKPFDSTELVSRILAALRSKNLADSLHEDAEVDALTGLWNRAYFDKCLAADLSISQRHAEPLTCVLADIDHFKSINDRHGNPAGDDVLNNVAQIFSRVMRKGDQLARISGEEFAILMPGTDESGAAMVAERLRILLEQSNFVREGVSISVTCSFGVADTGAGLSATAADLLERADKALYRAKRGGRNRVVTSRGFQPETGYRPARTAS